MDNYIACLPVVPPARRWFEFQMYASSWQGTSAVGLDLIAAGVCLLQHLARSTSAANHSLQARLTPGSHRPILHLPSCESPWRLLLLLQCYSYPLSTTLGCVALLPAARWTQPRRALQSLAVGPPDGDDY